MRKLNRFLLISILLICSINSTIAQDKQVDEKKLKKLAGDYYVNGNYATALEYFEKIEYFSPQSLYYRFLRSVCYINLNQQVDKAVKILEDISNKGELKEGKYKIPLGELYYYLAKSHHLLNDFDEAEAYYKKCLAAKKVEYYLYDEAKLGIEHCKNAREFIKTPVDVEIINVGKPVNSIYDEHSAIVTADQEQLLFTSRRPGNVGGKMDVFGYEDPDGMYFEDVYIATKTNDIWRKPYNIVDTINTFAQEASTGLSADGQTMFLYVSSAKKSGDVYYSKKYGNKWGVPKKMPSPINTGLYFEGHITISGTEQEVYFTSDRPNGFGGTDIYVCKKKSNGTWGPAENLGETINTEFDEEGPYIHADGKTLFFSSKAHNSMGGYDVFKSFLGEDGKWSKPENIGYPLNTSGDDVFFVLSADGTKGYMTSRRDGGLGGSDIYAVEIHYDLGDEPVVIVLKGVVNDLGQAVDAMIIVTDIDGNVIVGEYESNAASGDYLLVLPPDKNYDVHFKSKDGKYDKHVSVLLNDVDTFMQIENNINLRESVGKKTSLKNISFDPNTGEVDMKKSHQTLLQIEELIKSNPDLEIEVVVFTDTTSTKKLDLAKNLGKSLANEISNTISKTVHDKINYYENEVQVEVVKGNLQDQIIVQGDKLVVKKQDNLDLAIKESGEIAKEVERKTTEKPKDNSKASVDKEILNLEEKMSAYRNKSLENLFFKIQIAAFRKNISPNHSFFKGIKEVKLNIKFKDGITRYTVGHYMTFAEAIKTLEETKNKFSDCFITPYYNNERISLKDIRALFEAGN